MAKIERQMHSQWQGKGRVCTLLWDYRSLFGVVDRDQLGRDAVLLLWCRTSLVRFHKNCRACCARSNAFSCRVSHTHPHTSNSTVNDACLCFALNRPWQPRVAILSKYQQHL